MQYFHECFTLFNTCCLIWIINPEWRLNFRDPSKNLLPKLQTAISPKVFKSDNQFLARSKEVNQGFHLIFKLLGCGLRTMRQNFARLVFLIAFQHVSKHDEVSVNQSCPQWDKVATKENRKNGNFAVNFFLNFWNRFLNFGDIKSRIRENRAMLCNVV